MAQDQQQKKHQVLNKHSILGCNDSKVEPIEVPEWGGTIYLKVLIASDFAEYQNLTIKEQDAGDITKFKLRLLVKSICDERGERLFKDDEMDLLGKKNGIVIDVLFAKAMEINGRGKDAVDEAVKNLETTPN